MCWEVWTEFIWLEQEQVAGFYERYNDLLGCTKRGEFLTSKNLSFSRTLMDGVG
jgi:hypothetical protein